MAAFYYVIPWGPYGSSGENIPKYISGGKLLEPEIPTEGYSLINQGIEGDCVALVRGTVTETHDPLKAKSDVIQMVEQVDLDTSLTAGQASFADAALEARMIPGDWVIEGMSFRVLIKNLAKIFLFFQYMHGEGLTEKLFQGNRDLETRFQQLPGTLQARFQDAATAWGYGTIPPTTIMRVVLKRLFQEWSQSGPIIIGGLEL